jgi:hypothetical protein
VGQLVGPRRMELNRFRFRLTGRPVRYNLELNTFKLNVFIKKENGMYIVIAYAVYLAISLALTVWVARTLERNGRIFLVDAFQGNAGLADSVNRLLVVGFYLINAGYVTLALSTSGSLGSARAAMELVSDKIGVVLLVLGGMHFFNLYVFHRLRKRGNERAERTRTHPGGAWSPESAPLGKVLE